MAQLLSLAMFSAILLVSVMAIIATVKAELPYIKRAIGIEPAALPQLRYPRDARIRVIRSGKPAAVKPQRAVA